ncbi:MULTISPECIES: hypothetical protein [Halomonas]|uniref:hypothetical protein n=1 Tax=Halomonas TaxID=2745 RepID=UPI0014151A00|nr:hypothetical protein [Halomonas ventosae]
MNQETGRTSKTKWVSFVSCGGRVIVSQQFPVEIPGELLQVSCGITATYGVLAKELKHTERPLEVHARHHAAQSLQLCLRRPIAPVPDGFGQLLHIIDRKLERA